MKWFFALHAESPPSYFKMAKVALASAPECLEPHMIIVGGEHEDMNYFQSLGVTVHARELELEPDIARVFANRPIAALGAFARLEACYLTDEPCLYTDVDVLFTEDAADVDKLPTPPFFGAVSRHPRFPNNIHSGVLLFNPVGMRHSFPGFFDYVREHGRHDWVYDETPLGEFYRWRITELDSCWNWLSVWGRNDQAAIIHFAHRASPFWPQRAAELGIDEWGDDLSAVGRRRILDGRARWRTAALKVLEECDVP